MNVVIKRYKLWVAVCAFAVVSIASVCAEEIDNSAMVDAHNKWRAKVGVGEKLVYAPELAAKAQAWADELKNNNRCKMRHSPADGIYGENLYWASALEWSDGRVEMQEVSAEKIADSWASEKAHYDYANNRCARGKSCGHYTQMVWRTTRSVGCARAVCADTREQVWVCEYQPAGNWVGVKPY